MSTLLAAEDTGFHCACIRGQTFVAHCYDILLSKGQLTLVQLRKDLKDAFLSLESLNNEIHARSSKIFIVLRAPETHGVASIDEWCCRSDDAHSEDDTIEECGTAILVSITYYDLES